MSAFAGGNKYSFRERVSKFSGNIVPQPIELPETGVHAKTEPFDIPLLLMPGDREFISDEQVLAWPEETTHPVELRKLPGNHFFIRDHLWALAELMSGKIGTRLSVVHDHPGNG
ncbi:MAG: hypothetical protein AVDCRST_MAG56-3886 [uncultured Cytophagales bacterium]|uniref:Thioesterase n=1 Tax=uncultured Cytophagales bacterium TaxID=158755 RepID=A0A6J4IP73_9SPHI|nr:MAG: hypothetical protein AVDCRST_MAG56-3886 [uncultured Cytophagales bacterium]